jgi:hypothetical protein
MSASGLLALLGISGAVPDDVPDRARIDEAIREVLSRAEFRPHEPSWWERLVRWIGGYVGRAFDRLVGWIDLDTALGRVIVALLVIVLVAIVVHLVWSLVHFGGSGKKAASASEAGAAADSALPASGAVRRELESARALAASGDFAAAMHALYRATLFRLDERTLVRFEPSKTAGDYRRELAAAESRRTFGVLLDVFDPVAWGGRPAAHASFERMRAAASALGVPA